MTDHWGSWSADQPDFDGPDGGDFGPDGGDFGDLAPEHADDGGYPVEGFGPADADPGAGAGPFGDQPDPIGYDGFGAAPHRFDPYAEPDPYADGGPEFGPAGPPEVPAEVGFGPAAPPVGADPDLDPYADSGQWAAPLWAEPAGPELGPPPEPVDGYPWTDPGLLGDPAAPTGTAPDSGPVPGPDELADYAGEELPAEGDPWEALAGSDDPATSTLARFWYPEQR